jgi:glycosyltransferase involved in cell wall biosynthesis
LYISHLFFNFALAVNGAVIMRVAVMGRSIRNQLSGVGRYTCGLVEGLCDALPADSLTVFLPHDHAALGRSNFVPVRAPFPTPNEYTRTLWEQSVVPLEVRRRGICLYHSPNYILPLALDCPSVVTIHDLVFRSLPQVHRRTSRMYLSFFTAWAVRHARQLIAVSETTARELARYYPAARSKTTVIYQSLAPMFDQPPAPEAVQAFRERLGLQDPFVLFVGTLEPRKNLVRLLHAFQLLVAEWGLPHQLVICGALGWHSGPLRQALAEPALRERVHLAGYVPDADLPLWYAVADVFVYPSLFEGFGLPPLEAMACGTPVVVSRTPALCEAAGDAAVFVEATDTQSIAQGLAEVLTNPARAEALRERGRKRAKHFHRSISSNQMLELYRRVIHSE